jgi:hypothetical protein
MLANSRLDKPALGDLADHGIWLNQNANAVG